MNLSLLKTLTTDIIVKLRIQTRHIHLKQIFVYSQINQMFFISDGAAYRAGDTIPADPSKCTVTGLCQANSVIISASTCSSTEVCIGNNL